MGIVAVACNWIIPHWPVSKENGWCAYLSCTVTGLPTWFEPLGQVRRIFTSAGAMVHKKGMTVVAISEEPAAVPLQVAGPQLACCGVAMLPRTIAVRQRHLALADKTL